MDEKILSVFYKSPDEYISGERLSKKLGITRAGVWKHIEALRGQGYSIDAQPHSGYRITARPDKLLPFEISSGLKTKTIGKKIFSFDMVDSTMDAAGEIASRMRDEGMCVFSASQKKGRGRMGRSWSSPKQKGIYLSVILRPDITPAETPKLTLLAAVAVVNALKKFTNLPVEIKWPNDCLIKGKKVCGILTEMSAEQDKVRFLIIGIGININNKASDLPAGATSIRQELGKKVDRVEVAKALLKELDKLYSVFKKEGFGPVISQWRDHSATLGRHVKIQCRGYKIDGHATDVDSDGALLVRLDNGFVERVLAGDVMIMR